MNLILKEGLMDATIEGDAKLLGAGSVVLLMPGQTHVLKNAGDSPLTYYVVRYRSKKKMDLERGVAGGGSMMLDINTLPLKPSSRGAGRAYFDRATAMCERHEMHVTQLHKMGPSHDPHTHIETEIILIVSGKTTMTIEGVEYEGGAGDFFLMESELMHGIRNTSDEPCSYFAVKWN